MGGLLDPDVHSLHRNKCSCQLPVQGANLRASDAGRALHQRGGCLHQLQVIHMVMLNIFSELNVKCLLASFETFNLAGLFLAWALIFWLPNYFPDYKRPILLFMYLFLFLVCGMIYVCASTGGRSCWTVSRCSRRASWTGPSSWRRSSPPSQAQQRTPSKSSHYKLLVKNRNDIHCELNNIDINLYQKLIWKSVKIFCNLFLNNFYYSTTSVMDPHYGRKKEINPVPEVNTVRKKNVGI